MGRGQLTPEQMEQYEIEAAAASKRLQEDDEEKNNTPTSQPSKDGQSEQSNKTEAATAAPQEQEVNPGPPSPQEQQINQINETANQPAQQQDQQYFWDEGYDAGDFARNTAEGVLAVPSGMVDFGVDLINKIPGVNVPKIPEFENGIASSIRDMGNVIFGAALATKGIRGIRGAGMAKLPAGKVTNFVKSDPVVRFLGRTAEAAAGGYVADSVVQFNEEDDNLAAMVKTNAPAWLANRIPMEWTTVGVTNPDIIRERNRNEGLALGVFGDVLLGFGKAVKAAYGMGKFTKAMDQTFGQAEWIAKDPNKSINDVLKKTGGRNKEVMLESPGEKSVRTQREALDELGEAALKNDPDALNKPTKGIHDLYEDMESGVRTVDEGGIFGALTNVAQIKENIGTYWGRVGSVVSEARLKYGQIANGAAPTQQIVGEMAKILSEIGDFDAIFPNGLKSFKLDAKVINKLNRESTAEAIGEALGDKSMGVDQIFSMLDQFRVDGNIDVLKNPNLSEGIDIGIRKLTEEYLGANRAIASNATQQSLAGQVADMAEATRLAGENVGAVNSVNEQVLERLLYLMTERGMMGYRWGATGAALRVRNGMVTAGGKKARLEGIIENLKEKEIELFKKNREYVATLKTVAATKPEFLKPFMLANEFTGGNVNSVYNLNEFMRNNLSSLTKAIRDGKPEIPNQLVQGMWSNMYNSVLSAFATPIRALTGNVGGLIAKPITTMGGAALSLDMKTAQDGWMAMGAIGDSFKKGYDYMREVFVKASQDPSYYKDLSREDLAKIDLRGDNLEVLESYAKAAAKEGEMGPAVLLEQAKTLDDLANSPFLRFGANAMTALDGFTRAVVANGELRYKAISELRDEGVEITQEAVSAKANKYWSDARKGDFQSDAVDVQTKEIALNAESDLSKAISRGIARWPIARPLMMFPTTSINMLGMFSQYSPIFPFAKDINLIADVKTVDPQRMKEILVNRKLADAATPDAEVLTRYKRLVAELRGKKAVGTLAVSYGAFTFMNDGITGDGVYKEEVRRNNEVFRKPRRSIQIAPNLWKSYDGLGPVSDWIALTVTIMENATMLGETATANWLNKVGYVVGSSITEKSVLANVEPMMGILNGNAPSIERLAASVANSMIPLAGQRAEWARWIGAGTKETKKEFLDYMRNRNKFITKLPDEHDWLYGRPVGSEENFIVNAYNAISPFKITSGPRPEAEFLSLIEFDARPSISTDGKGNEYPKELQSKITKLMADPATNGIFLQAVKDEMKYAENTDWINNMRKARALGYSDDVVTLDEYEGVRSRLVYALNRSKEVAISNLTSAERQVMYDLQVRKNVVKDANRSGGPVDGPNFEVLLNYPR